MEVINKLITCGNNYRKYDGDRVIDTIVIHSTASDNAQGSLAWFNNKNAKVSAHYIIDKDKYIYKCVALNNIAYHAGVCNLTHANKRSVGIEIAQATKTPMTDFQREALDYLINEICKAYPIKYIVGHKEIAPKRKTDPFDATICHDMRVKYDKIGV